MLRLKSTKSFESHDKIIRALKPTVRSIGAKSSSDEQTYQNNPYTIKANILKKLDDDVCISKINLGENNSLFRFCLTHDDKFAIFATLKDIIIFELATKTVYHTFTDAHYAFIRNVVVTKDNTIISCSRDGTIKVWNFHLKQLLFKIDKAHGSSPVYAIALTADDDFLISAGDPNENGIKIWNWQERKCIATIPNPHKAEINAVITTRDMKYIISASGDKAIKFWNFGTWTLAHEFKYAHLSGILALALSKDDKTLFSASTDGSIAIWDLNKMQHVHLFLNAHSKHIWRINSICRDRFIISASLDSTLTIWDAKTKMHLHTFKHFDGEQLLSLQVTSDERYIIVGGKKGTLFTIDTGFEPDTCMIRDAHSITITGMQTINKNRQLITSSRDNHVVIWDLESNSAVHTFVHKNSKKLWNIAVSPDEKKLAMGNSEGQVYVWSLEDKAMLFKCEGNTNFGVSALIFSKDGSKIISGSHDWSIYIRDANSPTLLKKITDAHRDRISTLDITNDDKFLISGSMDKSISIWDMQNYKLIHNLENAHDAAVFSVKLTNDNRYLISGSNDRKLKVWELETMRTIHIFYTSHLTSVRNIIISTDDQFLVSVDSYCLVEIHHFKTKQKIYTYKGATGKECYSACFSSDNKKIFFARNESIHTFENPFSSLTIQYSDLSSPYRLFRFMPLTSYFNNSSLAHKKDMIKSYPQMIIHPYGWTWFHVAGIFSPCKETISACLESKIPFVIDIFGKTPLHYMLESEDMDVGSINLVLSQFNLILEVYQNPFELLTSLSDIFPKIIELDNSDVASFLNLYALSPEPAFREMVDGYGEIKGTNSTRFHLSSSVLYSYRTRENLIAFHSKQKLTIKILPPLWNYSLASEDMRTLITSLLSVSEQEIFRSPVVSALVSYLWRCSKPLYYFLGVLFTLQAVLISIYTGLEERQVGLEIPIFVLSLVFLIYETFQMIYDGLKIYLLSGWSYFDGIGNILTPGTLIAIWAGLEGETKKWLFSWILVFTYAKWISYFKVYHKTRKLIRVTIEIFKDIRSFATLLAFIIFSLSLIFLQFDRETPYKTHLLNSYRLLYTDFDVDYLSSPAMMFYFVIVIAVVSIVLLNMLITIMANTFAEVQERSLIVDSKEKLKLVAENMKVLRTLKLLIPRRKRVSDIERRKYLFYAQKKSEENTSTQERLEDQIDILKKALRDSNEQILGLQKRLDEQNEVHLQQARQAEEKIATLNEKFDQQRDLSLQQGKDIMGELAKMMTKLES